MSEVRSCQFSSWYSTFRNMDIATIQNNTTNKKTRKNVTIESIVIRPLSPEFIEYLLSDGVRLPECANKVSSCMNDGDTNNDGRWDISSDEEDGGDDGNGEKIKKYSFPTLTQEIQSAITSLGGARNLGCMPKLNWSSPKDATWINCGSLKCTKVGDVYLLLKSSDFVGFDLEKAWDGLAEDGCEGSTVKCYSTADEIGDLAKSEQSQATPMSDSRANESSTSNVVNDNQTSATKHVGGNSKPHDFEYELVLRKWCNLHPSMEFRCFVYNHELVAVSQRHPSKFYPHLQLPSDEPVHPFTDIIREFFQTYIQNRFAQGTIHKYVVDLYLDSQERVWVVDFNVWGERTDGLLFEWNELEALASAPAGNTIQRGDDVDSSSISIPEVRVVTKDMKSMTYDPLSSYRGPTDVMDLVHSGNVGAGGDGSMPSFEEFMKQCIRPSEM